MGMEYDPIVPSRQPDVRASDAERAQTVELLRRHHEAGRLTAEELAVHDHDGASWGAGVVRVGCDASSPVAGGTPRSPVVIVGLLRKCMGGGLAHQRSPVIGTAG